MANNDEYLILPGCDDTNRGDQALIWETVEIAKSAGFNGHYSMISTEKNGLQSKKVGIDPIAYILPHPSANSNTENDNIKYGISLKFKWALRSIVSLLIAIPLKTKITRQLVQRLLSKEQKKTLSIYKNARAAFVKGGGFLHAYGGIIDAYKIYFHLYHIDLAISMGIPVYVMPNSFGPFVDKFSRRMIRKTLEKCEVVYSRESISQKVLKETCNVNSLLSRDIAMYLKEDQHFDANVCLEEKNIKIDTGRMVGITVRPYRFPGNENGQELYNQYKKSVSNLIVWLKSKEYHPVLIEHVFSENYHERDIICINEIVELVKSKGHQVDVFSALDLNCKQMMSIYAKMNYLVGTRFHSVIFSLIGNVPAIAITYGGNKGNGVMRDLGLSDYAIPIDVIRENTLIQCFQKLVNNRESVIEKLKQNQKQIALDYDKIVSMVRGSNK